MRGRCRGWSRILRWRLGWLYPPPVTYVAALKETRWPHSFPGRGRLCLFTWNPPRVPFSLRTRWVCQVACSPVRSSKVYPVFMALGRLGRDVSEGLRCRQSYGRACAP